MSKAKVVRGNPLSLRMKLGLKKGPIKSIINLNKPQKAIIIAGMHSGPKIITKEKTISKPGREPTRQIVFEHEKDGKKLHENPEFDNYIFVEWPANWTPEGQYLRRERHLKNLIGQLKKGSLILNKVNLSERQIESWGLERSPALNEEDAKRVALLLETHLNANSQEDFNSKTISLYETLPESEKRKWPRVLASLESILQWEEASTLAKELKEKYNIPLIEIHSADDVHNSFVYASQEDRTKLIQDPNFKQIADFPIKTKAPYFPHEGPPILELAAADYITPEKRDEAVRKARTLDLDLSDETQVAPEYLVHEISEENTAKMAEEYHPFIRKMIPLLVDALTARTK